jgi:hypothetical protein
VVAARGPQHLRVYVRIDGDSELDGGGPSRHRRIDTTPVVSFQEASSPGNGSRSVAVLGDQRSSDLS